jgi:hypothetical protein
MSIEEYWVGKGVDFRKLWSDFEQGEGYIHKYHTMEVYLLQLKFKSYPSNSPLFNLEAVLKTSKGVFHNLKRTYLSPLEYDRAGPLFIYDISRGSVNWRFLAELKPLLLFGLAIWDQIKKGSQRYKAERIALIDRLQARFPNANLEEIISYIQSLPGLEEEFALKKLYTQNPSSVEISKSPFTGSIEQTERELLSFDDIASGSNEGK